VEVIENRGVGRRKCEEDGLKNFLKYSAQSETALWTYKIR